jgi:threonine synthase
VRRLICASNRNNVLADFIGTGVYDRNREFYTTNSPSMDILVSSNLERLLFDLSGRDDALTGGYMSALGAPGRYAVTPEILDRLRSSFGGGYCSDARALEIIGRVFRERGYLMDTHTAVAFGVLEDMRGAGDTVKTVVVSTASPFKFCDSVLEALGHNAGGGGPELIDRLEEASDMAAPRPLKSLRDKAARFTQSVERDGMADAVRGFLA